MEPCKFSYCVWKISDLVVSASARGPLYVSVINVYAPTHRASQEDKDKFFDNMRSVVDSIGADDLLLIMGISMLGWGVMGEMTHGIVR